MGTLDLCVKLINTDVRGRQFRNQPVEDGYAGEITAHESQQQRWRWRRQQPEAEQQQQQQSAIRSRRNPPLGGLVCGDRPDVREIFHRLSGGSQETTTEPTEFEGVGAGT